MNSREIRINPSASDEEINEKAVVEDNSNESRWRSSIRKKISRLGRKTRPVSCNLEASRNCRDEALRLSSQSLYLPSYSPPPLARTNVFDRNQRPLTSKTFLKDEENCGRNFFKRMFPLRKSESSKLDLKRGSCQLDYYPPALKTRTLDNIPEKSYLKDTRRYGEQENQIKLRFRKFVTRRSITSGISSFSSKFRDRLSLTPSNILCDSAKDLSCRGNEMNNTLQHANGNQPYRSKNNSISQGCPRTSKPYNNQMNGYENDYKHELSESTSPLCDGLGSIRYIDSSSEEEIDMCLENATSNRVTGLVRNEVFSSSFQGDYRPRLGADWITRRSLCLKQELSNETKNVHKVTPDKGESVSLETKEEESYVALSRSCNSVTSETSQLEASVSSSHITSQETLSNQLQFDTANEVTTLPQDTFDSIEECSSTLKIRETFSESVYEANLEEILETSDAEVYELLKKPASLQFVTERHSSGQEPANKTLIQNKELIKVENKVNHASQTKEKHSLKNGHANEDHYSNESDHYTNMSEIPQVFDIGNVLNAPNIKQKSHINLDIELDPDNDACISLTDVNHTVNTLSSECPVEFDTTVDSTMIADKILSSMSGYNSIVNLYEFRKIKESNNCTLSSSTQFLQTAKLFDITGNIYFSEFLTKLVQAYKEISEYGICATNCSQILRAEYPENIILHHNFPISDTFVHAKEDWLPDKNTFVSHQIREEENVSQKMLNDKVDSDKISLPKTCPREIDSPPKGKRKRRKRNRKKKPQTTLKTIKTDSLESEAIHVTYQDNSTPSSGLQQSSTPKFIPLVTCTSPATPDETPPHLDWDWQPGNMGYPIQSYPPIDLNHPGGVKEQENRVSEDEYLAGADEKRDVASTSGVKLFYGTESFDYVELEECFEDIKPIETIRFRLMYQRKSSDEEPLTSDSYEQCRDLRLAELEDDPSWRIHPRHENLKMNGRKVCQSVSEKSRLFCEPHNQKGVNTLRPKDVIKRSFHCSQWLNHLKRLNHVQCLGHTLTTGRCATIDIHLENGFDPVTANRTGERNACGPNLKNSPRKTHVFFRDQRKTSLERYRWGDASDEMSDLPPNASLLTHTTDCHGRENKSVRWILSEGEDVLESHQIPSNTLKGITKEVDNFRDFYAFAKFESEKSLSLLQEEEHLEMCSETSDETQDLSKDLRRHISSFADRLHLTKDRLEDTAKCYRLLDKAYAWALEAMKVEGRVKSSGAATREQVATAADAIGELLQEGPPVSEETFVAMLDLATRLDNQTLLQQCKMADSRCRETISLLRSRQAALLKARHQMEFDCQAFVDLNDILSLSEEQFPPSPAFFPVMPFNASGRRRSGCPVSSRSRDPLSRCSSLETDDDSVFPELPYSSTPTKNPVEGKSSLRGIKELRESHEDLVETGGFVRSNCNFFRSSIGSDFRLNSDPPPLGSCPSTMNTISSSTIRAFSSGSSSSCSSSDSSGPTSGNKKAIWRFTETGRRSLEEANEALDDSILRLSSIHPRASLPSEANSHLLIRGSQINLSNSEDLTQEEVKKNKTLLLIMEELVRTERDYVYYLEYIIENYIPELLRDDIPQALRGQRNVIFGNIEKIYEFHSGYFLKALESCNAKPFSLGSVFLRYENQFYLYALYNKNKPKSDELMADFGSSFFKAKQTALGDKMDLSSYLLKPFQRMGKYALLLKQLLKECSKNEEGYEELAAAQEMVQFQLRHGNDLLAMDSLRDSDVNLKEQGRLLRQGEFLVMEGSRGKKSLRHVFLFEDLILFSKARRDPEKKNLDIFQYKQSLKTTDIGLTAQVGESPLRFEIWFRKRKPSDIFLFQAPSAEVKEAWTEEISKLLWRQALKNRKLRLHEMSSMGIGNKPCLDIRPSEDQINDRSVCITKAPTRIKLAASTSLTDTTTAVRRPHSVISVSSSASSAESSTHSSSAGPSFVGTLNLGFESGDSPKPLQRSVTRTSQCSAESGIITDIFPERDVEENHSREAEENHPRVERSNSTATNTSLDSALSPLSPPPVLSPLEEPPSLTQLSSNVDPSKEITQLLTTQTTEDSRENSPDWEKNLV